MNWNLPRHHWIVNQFIHRSHRYWLHWIIARVVFLRHSVFAEISLEWQKKNSLIHILSYCRMIICGDAEPTARRDGEKKIMCFFSLAKIYVYCMHRQRSAKVWDNMHRQHTINRNKSERAEKSSLFGITHSSAQMCLHKSSQTIRRTMLVVSIFFCAPAVYVSSCSTMSCIRTSDCRLQRRVSYFIPMWKHSNLIPVTPVEARVYANAVYDESAEQQPTKGRMLRALWNGTHD